MKFRVEIKEIKTVNEFPAYWNNEDYIALLQDFDFSDAEKINSNELLEMLNLAISDFEPDEAATIVLNYKLSEQLNSGQIQTLSHDMMDDKVAEEYPEPALHYDLFNINQLLHKAYNGRFPNTEASIIDLEIAPLKAGTVEINKEILIKSLASGLKDNNLIKRLFEEQIDGTEAFTDAAKTIWKIDKANDHHYQVATSKYWLDKDDFLAFEFEAEVVLFEED